MMLVYASFAT